MRSIVLDYDSGLLAIVGQSGDDERLVHPLHPSARSSGSMSGVSRLSQHFVLSSPRALFRLYGSWVVILEDFLLSLHSEPAV